MHNPLTFQNYPFILFVGFDEHVLNVNTSKFGLSKKSFCCHNPQDIQEGKIDIFYAKK